MHCLYSGYRFKGWPYNQWDWWSSRDLSRHFFLTNIGLADSCAIMLPYQPLLNLTLVGPLHWLNSSLSRRIINGLFGCFMERYRSDFSSLIYILPVEQGSAAAIHNHEGGCCYASHIQLGIVNECVSQEAIPSIRKIQWEEVDWKVYGKHGHHSRW